MGFLLGAFGKLSAGRRMRQLQARMMRVQSRVRRVTRDAEKMEKQLQQAEKRELNNLTLYTNGIYNNAYQTLMNQTQIAGTNMNLAQGLEAWTKGQLDTNQQAAMNQAQATIANALTSMKAQNDQTAATLKQQIEDKYEMLREQMLEPIKDEEELLQNEKDSLESQYEMAKQDYTACKQMEKEDAKNMAPSYTGVGQG